MVWDVPESYSVRQAALGDVEQIVEVMNACSLEIVGVRTHTVEDQLADWQSPGFDPSRDARVVLSPEGRVVGCADVWDLDEPHVRIFSRGNVHPDHRDRGIGCSLLQWTQHRASESIRLAPAGARVTLSQSIFEQELQAQALLEDAGFSLSRVFSRMVIDMEDAPASPSWPDGVCVRGYRQDDLEPTVRMVQTAFCDHWGHVDVPFEEELKQWRHWTTAYKDFDPGLWFLAVDGSTGEIVGVVLGWPTTPEDPKMGWIEVVGVLRDWRGRGLGLALLRHAFGEFHRRGYRKVGLGVDAASLTGATRLYARAGMKPMRRKLNFEKELRSGEDLSRRELDAD